MRRPDGTDNARAARDRRAASAGAAILACAAAAAAMALAPPPEAGAPGSRSAWRGYTALLVESGADEGRVLDRLASAGVRDAISESTEPVVVSDWARLSTTTLADARRSLVPGDARLDSYISRLGSWFEARVGQEAFRVIYVPEGALADSSGRIEKAMSGLGVSYLLPDSRESGPAGPPAAASFASAAIVLVGASALGALLGRAGPAAAGRSLRRPSRRALESSVLRLALAAPFAAAAWRGGWASLAAALWGLAVIDAADALEPALEEMRFGKRPRIALGSLARGVPRALALWASALIAAAAMTSTIPSIIAAAAAAALAAAAFALSAPKSRRRFAPLAIGGARPGTVTPASTARAVLACLAIAASLASYAVSGARGSASSGGKGISYPTPAAIPGAAEPLPAQARERLALESAEGRLPSLASWLAHIARQESIPYSRLGEARPEPFASVSLPSTGGAEARLVFDDEWARSAYRALPARSIEGIIASQGRTVAGVSGGGTAPSPRTARPLAPIRALLYILLLIPPLAGIAASIPAARGASSRRLRQEA
jgi:hypothetical protein